MKLYKIEFPYAVGGIVVDDKGAIKKCPPLFIWLLKSDIATIGKMMKTNKLKPPQLIGEWEEPDGPGAADGLYSVLLEDLLFSRKGKITY